MENNEISAALLRGGRSSVRAAPRPRSWRRMLLATLLLAALAALQGAGCNQSEGTGEITGTLNLPECDGVHGEFSMSLDFFALERFGDGLVLRLQHGGRGMEVDDALLLTIYDVQGVQARRGEELPVTPLDMERKGAGDYVQCAGEADKKPDWCPLLRADLNLPSRCPYDATAPLLEGSAVFTHLGTEPNERVAGSFELTATDARSGGEVGQLSGHFNFLVRQGHPYQRFPH